MKHLYSVMLLCCLALQSFAQRNSIPEPVPPVSSFMLGTIYGNTENYYGQSPDDKLPYLLFYTGYTSKSGFALSLSAEKLLNSGTGIAATDVYAGYSFDLTKRFKSTIGYTHYFYQKDSPLLGTSNQNNLGGSLSYNWAIKTGIGVNYYFGTENDVFMSLHNSRMIDFGKLFSDKDYISIELTVDITGGTVHFYETYTTETNKRRTGLNLPPKPVPASTESSSFGILAYTFSLPLVYSRAHYSIEASYQASVQGRRFSSGSSTSASVVNLGFYYTF